MNKWYRIEAKNNKATILIYEQIGEDWFGEGVSAKKFVGELNALDVDFIDLHINSPGGSVFDGTSIYNALKRHKAKVDVTIDGIAASIASVIAMAGDSVEMPHNALMMMHDPSALVRGTAADMLKMVAALDRIKTGMVAAYMDRSSLAENEISAMMTDETWMTAAEAVERGFADKTTGPVKMSASFQALANFKNVPAAITVKKSTNKLEGKKMKINLELIQSEHPEIVAAIQKTVDLEYIRANCPQVVEALQAQGATNGAEAERDRIRAVRAQLIPGHEALIEELMFDGQTSGEQAAVKVLAAEKKIRAEVMKDHRSDAPDKLKQPPTDDVSTMGDDNLPVAERCKAKWDKDAELRNEFNDDYDAYLAYEKAVQGGQVRELNKK